MSAGGGDMLEFKLDFEIMTTSRAYGVYLA